MKTFEQIFRKMFNDIYKSPEGWPDNLSIIEVHNRAAKKYAKQWVKEALQNEPDSFIEYYLKAIDEQ